MFFTRKRREEFKEEIMAEVNNHLRTQKSIILADAEMQISKSVAELRSKVKHCPTALDFTIFKQEIRDALKPAKKKKAKKKKKRKVKK